MTKKKTSTKDSRPPLVQAPTEGLDFKKEFVDVRRAATDNIGGTLPIPTQQLIPVKKKATAKSMKGKKFKSSDLTVDSFANFTARLGIQADNLSSGGYYNLGPFISRNRLELEAAYRDSWIVGAAVDCIAEDMTRDGMVLLSESKPGDIEKLQVAMSEMNIWHDLCMSIKWARLYGGCLAVMMIDGADYKTPLNIETIGKDKFKGLVVLDRWMVQPSMGELITDLGKDIGKPKFYEALPGVSVFPTMRIHHSRVIRFDGIELPYYQKLFENLWGLSVIERMLDRLMAFDSATLGAAQLLYKAYLRVIKVKGFREALALGGKTEESVIKQFMYIRMMQNNEGITVLDGDDEFDVHAYAFAGVSDALQQFGQQISGATGIPLVRLFGQSPAGLSSTGESDLRNYYDHILKLQETMLRPQMDKLLAVISRSVLGGDLPEDLEFKFVPLWQMSEKEKAEIASTDATTMAAAHDAGLISIKVAMKELQQSSRATGRFTNITDKDIKEAEEEIPPAAGLLPGASGAEAAGGEKSKEEEDPNARLGGANPDLPKDDSEKNKAGDKVTFRDVLDSWGETIQKAKRLLSGDDFKESEHPRGKGEKGGQFVSKGEGGIPGKKSEEGKEKTASKEEPKPAKGKMLSAKVVDGKVVAVDGKPLPEHLQKGVSPKWKDIVYSPDPNADMWAKGKDDKGRGQYLYHPDHWSKAEKEKFALVSELNKKFEGILKENQSNMKGENSEEAVVLDLIIKAGVRPESEIDTKAAKKAYGATTLEGQHVVTDKDGNVMLNFIGKKGVENKLPIKDPNLAKMLVQRAKKAGKNGKLFNSTYGDLLKYTKKLDGGKFTPKDFRTLLGTKFAMDVMNDMEEPKDEKTRKQAILKVAKAVASKLGNTPAIALKAYIDKSVFSKWEAA